jgi:hypothetical protein
MDGLLTSGSLLAMSSLPPIADKRGSGWIVICAKKKDCLTAAFSSNSD